MAQSQLAPLFCDSVGDSNTAIRETDRAASSARLSRKLFFNGWLEAHLTLRARARSLDNDLFALLAERGRFDERVEHVQRALAALRQTRDALLELHSVAFDGSFAALVTDGATFVRYVTRAFAFCESLIESIREAMQRPEAQQNEPSGVGADALKMVHGDLAPLFRQLMSEISEGGDRSLPFARARDEARRFHASLVRLTWELQRL